MVLVFVYWCVRLGYVMERERYEEKLRFGRDMKKSFDFIQELFKMVLLLG